MLSLSVNDLLAYLSVQLALALLLDRLLGEPRRLHPLVGFGDFAARIESHLNPAGADANSARLRGAVAWALAVLGCTALLLGILAVLSWGLTSSPVLENTMGIVVLYICIAWRSLGEHARAVINALQSNDLPLGRKRVSYIVSRDTGGLDESAVAKAAIESTLENGSDGIFAPIFWFAILGVPGVVIYRLANTLDAMWGYRNNRFKYFGFTAAKVDDFLNYIPARLTAVSYALLGHSKTAFRCWHRQAKQCPSPNGGPVMCAGAGALGVRLGGRCSYHGIPQWRSRMGCGRLPCSKDLHAAVRLIDKTVCLWLIVLILLELWFV